MGLSFGGPVTATFAGRHPARVRSLTLANTSPGFGVMTPEQLRTFVEQRRNLDPEAQAKRLLGPKPPRGAFDTLVASMRALHRESHLKTIEASVAQDLAAPIEEIRAPTLVIGSTHDTLYPRRIAEDVARRISGARLL